jgi:hypothetical protein
MHMVLRFTRFDLNRYTPFRYGKTLQPLPLGLRVACVASCKATLPGVTVLIQTSFVYTG